MQEMEPLSSVLETLKKRGYTIDFNQKPMLDELNQNAQQYHIEKIYRFEGETDPQDEAALLSISKKDGSMKGYLVNGYGLYSDEQINRVIGKLMHSA